MQIISPKIQKMDTEIDRITDRISKLQGKLEELRGQRAEMYNADLLTIIRDIPPEQLRAFANKMKAQNPTMEGRDSTV